MGLGPPWAPWHGVPRCRPVPYWWLPSNQKVDLPLPRYTVLWEQDREKSKLCGSIAFTQCRY